MSSLNSDPDKAHSPQNLCPPPAAHTPAAPCAAAKNVILAGVKAVVLQDSSAVELRDLGAQFYLAEGDVGSSRAAACEAKLQELNSAVAVSSSQEHLSESFIAPFDVPLLLPPLRARSSAVAVYLRLLSFEPVPWHPGVLAAAYHSYQISPDLPQYEPCSA